MATLQVPTQVQAQHDSHPPIGTIIFNCFTDVVSATAKNCNCIQRVRPDPEPEISLMELQRIEHEKELLMIRDHPIRRKRKASVAPSINAITELGELEDLSEKTGEEASKCATTLTSWEQKKMTRRLSRRLSQAPPQGGMDSIQEISFLQTARLQALADKAMIQDNNSAIDSKTSFFTRMSDGNKVRQSTDFVPKISVDMNESDNDFMPVPGTFNRSRRPSNVCADNNVIAVRDQFLKRRFSIAAGAGGVLLGLDNASSISRINNLKSTEVLTDKFSSSNMNSSEDHFSTSRAGNSNIPNSTSAHVAKTTSQSGLPKTYHMSNTSLGRMNNNKHKLAAPRARGRRMSMVSMDCIPGSSLNLEKDRNCQVLAGVIPDENENPKEENESPIIESGSRYENRNFATFNSDLVEKVKDRIVYGDVISEENLVIEEEMSSDTKSKGEEKAGSFIDDDHKVETDNNNNSVIQNRQSTSSAKPRITAFSNTRRDSAFSIPESSGKDAGAVLSNLQDSRGRRLSADILENLNEDDNIMIEENKIDEIEKSIEDAGLLDMNDMMPDLDAMLEESANDLAQEDKRVSQTGGMENNQQPNRTSTTSTMSYTPRKASVSNQINPEDNTSSLILKNLKDREAVYTQKIQAMKKREKAAKEKAKEKFTSRKK